MQEELEKRKCYIQQLKKFVRLIHLRQIRCI